MPQTGGRRLIGTRPASVRNDGRLQIGTLAGFKSEYPADFNRNPQPLGIPTFEDKIAQRAIARPLEAIYEQDFLPCSYGFRPGRSAHQALHALRSAIWSQRLHWVLDVDIRKYFDTISHSHLRAFLDKRVTDGVIRRMIDKWLKAGVIEDGLLHHTTAGSPQGA